MTEKIDTSVTPERREGAAPPRLRPRFWSTRPVAFFTALFAAPLLVAGVGGALTAVGGAGAIVLAGVAFAMPVYFLAGAPIAWLTALKDPKDAGAFAVAGLLANIAAAPMLVLIGAAFSDPIQPGVMIALFTTAVGMVVAPMFGLLAGFLYLRLRRLGAPRAAPRSAAPVSADVQ